MNRVWRLTLVVAMFALTGCENGNLFGKLHDRGDSRDARTLNSDATIALREKNYSEALRLYEAVLAQEPNNASALYGASAAAIGGSGLNFGQLISNLLSQSSSAPSIHSLNDYIASARETFAAAADPDSLLNGVDLEALNEVIDLAICRLQKITAGAADGSIPTNDVAVLLDLGSLCLIRGVLRPLRANYFDIKNVGGSYQMVQKGDFGGFCANAANRTLIENTGRDLAGAYALFNRAATQLGLDDNAIISRVRSDIDEVVTELLDGDTTGDLEPACVVILANIGITAASFRSYTGPFSSPSGC